MIKNIIFDFDGVLVDSEVIVARALSKYLAKRDIKFEENEFSKFAGQKTVEVVSRLSSIFEIKDQKKFFNDMMLIAKDLYTTKLETVPGVNNFLEKIVFKKFIGSNNILERIELGLKNVGLDNYFQKESIFSFDLVGIPKPEPDIYLKAIESHKLNKLETIIIEDSSIGVQAGVKAGIKVIGLTAAGHWYKDRSKNELYDAGAYKVVNNYEEMLLLVNNL